MATIPRGNIADAATVADLSDKQRAFAQRVLRLLHDGGYFESFKVEQRDNLPSDQEPTGWHWYIETKSSGSSQMWQVWPELVEGAAGDVAALVVAEARQRTEHAIRKQEE